MKHEEVNSTDTHNDNGSAFVVLRKQRGKSGGSYGGSTVSTTAASKSTKVKDKEYVLDYSGSELPGKYTGDWAEGMSDGYGEFTYDSDSVTSRYVGEWANGFFNGDGECKVQTANIRSISGINQKSVGSNMPALLRIVKAIPHNYCRATPPSDFSSGCTEISQAY